MTEYKSIKEEVLKKLEDNLTEIRERFGIETIGIFGSVSRGEDTPDSDIDILYRFKNGNIPLKKYIGFYEYLRALFGREVDIVSMDFIEPSLIPSVQTDMIIYQPRAEV